MAKIVLKESDIQRMIKDAINEGIKDKIMNGASKLGSKIKKGWDNYEEWCTDGLEAENPSQVDFKEFGKETIKDMGSKIKKGWNKYKNWVEKDMDAPNPAYLGDPKDLEECGVKESLRKSIKSMVKEAINEISGWKLEEDDYVDVNSDQEEYYNKCYIVRIWSGSGYILPAYKVYANNEEEALEITVAWLEKNEPDMLKDD